MPNSITFEDITFNYTSANAEVPGHVQGRNEAFSYLIAKAAKWKRGFDNND